MQCVGVWVQWQHFSNSSRTKVSSKLLDNLIVDEAVVPEFLFRPAVSSDTDCIFLRQRGFEPRLLPVVLVLLSGRTNRFPQVALVAVFAQCMSAPNRMNHGKPAKGHLVHFPVGILEHLRHEAIAVLLLKLASVSRQSSRNVLHMRQEQAQPVLP